MAAELWRSSRLYQLLSWLSAIWRHLLELPAPRVLVRREQRLSALLWRLGHGENSPVENSLVCRWLDRLSQAAHESRILGPLLRGGVRIWLFVLLGCFGVVDWLLRDVLAVPVLGSVWDELLLLLALWTLLRQAVRDASPLPVRTSALSFPMLQFFAVCIALFLVHLDEHVDVSVLGLRATCQSILWFPLLLRLLRRERDVQLICRCMVVSAFLIALHGIYQYVVAAPIPAGWTDQAEAAVRTRAYSIFGSPNILGDFLTLFSPMALAMVYEAKTLRRRLGLLVMTGCMLLCCLFTMSRGAWLGLFAAAVVFSLLYDRRLLLLLLGGTGLALLLPFVASRISYLFTDAYVYSAALGGRSLRWTKALGYLYREGAALTGLGFGRFGGAVAAQHHLRADWEYFYVDNYYIKILVENGWIGLISYCFMLLGLLFAGLQSRKRCPPARRPMVSGMLAGLVGVLVHCWFENIFEEPYMLVYFWAVAAMMVFLASQKNSTPISLRR